MKKSWQSQLSACFLKALKHIAFIHQLSSTSQWVKVQTPTLKNEVTKSLFCVSQATDNSKCLSAFHLQPEIHQSCLIAAAQGNLQLAALTYQVPFNPGIFFKSMICRNIQTAILDYLCANPTCYTNKVANLHDWESFGRIEAVCNRESKQSNLFE